MDRYKKKHKFLHSASLFFAFSIIPLLSSCNKSFSTSWSGLPSTYEKNYKKYDKTTILYTDSYKIFLKNKFFKKMLSQEIIYNMNHLCDLFPEYDQDELKYQFKFCSIHNNRLSYNIKMFNPKNQLILKIDASNLPYVPSYDHANDRLMFLFKNVSYENGYYTVNEEFWDDMLFHIVLLTFSDGQLDLNYDFCYKESEPLEKIEFETTYVAWFLFAPLFYEGVTVI